MKLCYWGKDGGRESRVSGFWLIEIKSWFSIVLLRFDNGTRDAYHEHAFNCVSWLLSGALLERFVDGSMPVLHRVSWRPIVTRRETFHQVESFGRSWVLSFRGPWVDHWREFSEGEFINLTHGRREVA